MTIKFLGLYVNCPIYVLSGVAKQHAIFGMDFVWKQQLCVEADHVIFQKKFHLKIQCLVLLLRHQKTSRHHLVLFPY